MREFLKRLTSFFQSARHERELDAEMEAHIGFATEENIRAGMDPVEAKRQAMLRFGGRESAKELQREARSLPFLEMLQQDLRYSLRTMRRQPGFALFALMIVALGTGASATVFSVLNTILIRALPFKDAGNLVWISNAPSDEGMSAQTLQVIPFLSLKERSRSFSDMTAYFAFYGVGDSKLQVNGEVERLNALGVAQNFFPFLGVQPMLGRQFNDDECKWNGPRSILLSYGLWQRRFAADTRIVGKTVTLDDKSVTIIGVLPATFDYGTVFAPGTHMDIYYPFPLVKETDRWGNTLSVIGHIRSGTPWGSAQAEANVLGARITKENPNRNNLTPLLTPLEVHVSGRLRPALKLLGFAVGVVMLIVCANLSNLLLARSTARQKEIAIRSALGASRGRLIRQILTESLLLAVSGGLLGTGLAFLGTRALAGMTSVKIPRLADVRLDVEALLFTLLLAGLTGIVFGLVPALQAPRLTVNRALKEQTRGSTDSRQHAWIRGSLVVLEIAFACVLMVGSGLMIRSFLRVLDVNLGFQPAHAARLRVDPSNGFPTIVKANAYFDEVLRRVRDIPGIESAGLSDALPLGRNRQWGAAAQGVVYPTGQYPSAFIRIVSDGYLRALGVPLVAGRDLSPTDGNANDKVVMVNETLARNLWPGQNALGKLLRVGQGNDKRVIAIVKDVRHLALEQGSGPEVYLPFRQGSDYQSIDLVVRTKLETNELTRRVRAQLLPLDPTLPHEQFRPLEELVDRAISPRRFIVLLLAGFACFALILASLGIYAVISYSVGQRTQEIGIRMALGASAGELQRGILFQTLKLAGIGLFTGTVFSLGVTRVVKGLLFGVTAEDPFTFAAMLAVLTLVAALAGYLPARRASKIDPMVALRAD